MVTKRTDLLGNEFAAKLSYNSCTRAQGAKYHKDCMHQFLSGDTVIPGLINYKHFISSKNDGFSNCSDLHESTSYDTTSFLVYSF